MIYIGDMRFKGIDFSFGFDGGISSLSLAQGRSIKPGA